MVKFKPGYLHESQNIRNVSKRVEPYLPRQVYTDIRFRCEIVLWAPVRLQAWNQLREQISTTIWESLNQGGNSGSTA